MCISFIFRRAEAQVLGLGNFGYKNNKNYLPSDIKFYCGSQTNCFILVGSCGQILTLKPSPSSLEAFLTFLDLPDKSQCSFTFITNFSLVVPCMARQQQNDRHSVRKKLPKTLRQLE